MRSPVVEWGPHSPAIRRWSALRTGPLRRDAGTHDIITHASQEDRMYIDWNYCRHVNRGDGEHDED